MIEVPLKHGVLLLDDEDADVLDAGRWYSVAILNTHYARMSTSARRDGQRSWYLHRFLIRPERGVLIDHVNGNGLDNRRANLRLATHAQNLANRGPIRGKQYKGICQIKNGRWQAKITVNRKQIHLGFYPTAEEAAAAYAAAAPRYVGEFAHS